MFTLIEFLHVYEIDPATGRERNAERPFHSLWLYPGPISDSDKEIEPEFECWIRKHAIRLDGTWFDRQEFSKASQHISELLRQGGHEVAVEFFVND